MPALYHDEIELLSAAEIERIFRVADEFELHRDFVVIPLNCAPEGKAVVLPDGCLLLRAPGGDRFEPWLEGLRTRLAECDLSRTPRRSEEDPKKHLTGTHGPRFSGTRGYLERPGKSTRAARRDRAAIPPRSSVPAAVEES